MEVTVSFPESLKPFIEAEVTAGSHGTAAHYVQALVEDAKKRKSIEKLEALLEEGLQSGPATEWTEQDWEDISREIEERHEHRTGNRQ